MTAPGDPLIASPGGSEYRRALRHYSEFPLLANEVEAVMLQRRKAETEPLWTKTHRGQTLRGIIATLESTDTEGRSSAFQVHYIAGNDRRSPTHLTSGTFSAEDRRQLVLDNDGTPLKGGRP